MCGEKVRYASIMQAVNAGVRTGLTWYRCDYCGGYHLTSANRPLDM